MSKHTSAELAKRVRQRAKQTCEYCRLPQQWQEATFHIDHILPQSKGGKTVLSNLALACVTCSLRKAARTESKDPKSGTPAKLFNPRVDRWPQHFKLTATFRLQSITKTGRATINALGMNRAALIAIRRELSELD